MGRQRRRANSGVRNGGGGAEHRSVRRGEGDDGRIVVEPPEAPVYDLDQLLDQMNPETFSEGVDFGPSVGREAW